MQPTTIIFVKADDKKHSIRYNGVTDSGKPISFYIPKDVLGAQAPNKVEVSIKTAG